MGPGPLPRKTCGPKLPIFRRFYDHLGTSRLKRKYLLKETSLINRNNNFHYERSSTNPKTWCTAEIKWLFSHPRIFVINVFTRSSQNGTQPNYVTYSEVSQVCKCTSKILEFPPLKHWTPKSLLVVLRRHIYKARIFSRKRVTDKRKTEV